MILRQTSHTITTEIPLKKRLETGLSLFGHLQIAVFLRFEPSIRKPQIQRNVKQNRDLRSEYRQTSKFVYGFLDCSVAHQATCSFLWVTSGATGRQMRRASHFFASRPTNLHFLSISPLGQPFGATMNCSLDTGVTRGGLAWIAGREITALEDSAHRPLSRRGEGFAESANFFPMRVEYRRPRST